MKSLTLAFAIILVAGTAQAQQGKVCTGQLARHCLVCAAQQAQAFYRAGEPHQVRLVRETARRGGTFAAAQSLSNTRDYQFGLRAARRACGCPSWC